MLFGEVVVEVRGIEAWQSVQRCRRLGRREDADDDDAGVGAGQQVVLQPRVIEKTRSASAARSSRKPASGVPPGLRCAVGRPGALGSKLSGTPRLGATTVHRS
jgi:hypothetical protein